MRYLKILSWLGAVVPVSCSQSSSPPPESACPECDTDQDTIPDKDDACPTLFATTHDGCPPQAAVTGPIDVSIPDVGSYIPLDASDAAQDTGGGGGPSGDFFVLNRQEQPICPALAKNGSGNAWVVWQEGPNILRGRLGLGTLEEGIQETELLDENPDSNFTQCNIRRAIATNEQGDVALVWGKLIDGNHLLLHVRLKDEVWTVTDFPLRHLGEERRNYIASLTALPDGKFLLVWTDNDRVMGQKLDVDQGPLEDPVLLSRKIEVLHVTNPDIASVDQNRVRIVWQEGSEPLGNIVEAELNSETLEISGRQTLEEGIWPAVSRRGIEHVVSWVDRDHVGQIETPSTKLTFGEEPRGSFPFPPMIRPQILVNEEGRLFALWSVLSGRGIENFQLADFGANLSREGKNAHYVGQPVGEGIAKTGVDLLAIEGGLLLVYSPVLIPKSLRFQKITGEQERGRDE